jgi:hypothetical protein
MKIFQVPGARKMVEAYQDGYITLRELTEELEWYWDKKIYKGTKAPFAERTGVPVPAILEKDG